MAVVFVLFASWNLINSANLMAVPWINSVIPIAAIFSFRMLGLFMLIPVFTVLATQLSGATPSLLGIALGIYGLSQGLLQIPFGMLSDRFGRKPLITIGLLLFAMGSLLGALSHTIYGMIMARALQGGGAIGSVLIALLADLTPDQQRTKAMAVLGMSIGLSFSLALIISPAITHYFGLPGIFYLTTILALFGLFMLHSCIPTPQQERFHPASEANPRIFRQVLSDPNLQKLNLGIFLQHLILTSTFYAIPMLIQKQLQQGYLSQQWQLYLPLMVVAFLAMIPFIIYAEKKQVMRRIFILAISLITVSQLLLTQPLRDTLFGLFILMLAYFVGFNILEAALPSEISKQAHKDAKGTAMGIYSTCQFLGIFMGGSLAGFLFQLGSINGIFLANAALSMLWVAIAWSMR